MKLTINEASKLMGVSISTLRRWESEGKLIPERTKGGIEDTIKKIFSQ